MLSSSDPEGFPKLRAARSIRVGGTIFSQIPQRFLRHLGILVNGISVGRHFDLSFYPIGWFCQLKLGVADCTCGVQSVMLANSRNYLQANCVLRVEFSSSCQYPTGGFILQSVLIDPFPADRASRPSLQPATELFRIPVLLKRGVDRTLGGRRKPEYDDSLWSSVAEGPGDELGGAGSHDGRDSAAPRENPWTYERSGFAQ